MWGMAFTDCRFRGANLRDVAMGGISQEGRRNRYLRVDFTKADMRGTAHFSSDMIGCDFSHANLGKVEFQGTVFVDCAFAGVVYDAQFHRYAFEGEAHPPNEMKGVDFRGAKLGSSASIGWI